MLETDEGATQLERQIKSSRNFGWDALFVPTLAGRSTLRPYGNCLNEGANFVAWQHRKQLEFSRNYLMKRIVSG
jgi:hypothetical protein